MRASLKWLNSSSGAIVRRRERGSRTKRGTNFDSRGFSQTFVFWYQYSSPKSPPYATRSVGV